jgi:hypothetical protein
LAIKASWSILASAAKAASQKKVTYRSAQALRHPKSGLQKKLVNNPGGSPQALKRGAF